MEYIYGMRYSNEKPISTNGRTLYLLSTLNRKLAQNILTWFTCATYCENVRVYVFRDRCRYILYVDIQMQLLLLVLPLMEI